MLKKITIKNIKCFEILELELESLNVLAGINSMGKSTIIQTLLLLKQSFDMGAIENGLYLNGDLVTIGTGYDLLNRTSEEDSMGIEINTADDTYSWSYEYDRSSDYQKIRETNVVLKDLAKLNIFSSNFSYISADRIGPRRYYLQSYHRVIDNNDVGKQGELFADYLAEKGLTDKITNKEILHYSEKSDVLVYQMEAWLSEISPGLHLHTKKYQEAGIVGMEYRVSSENYSPLNVGFGISYVAPIIINLLKAQSGDLVILENPEAHLHPKGQRKMGELIACAAAGGVQIIVETHSDHLLNGIRLMVKNKKLSRNNVRLNYFYQRVEKNEGLPEKIVHKKTSPAILEDGRLSSWPDGFFDEWDKALDELL